MGLCIFYSGLRTVARDWFLKNFIPKKESDINIIEINPEEVEEHDRFK